MDRDRFDILTRLVAASRSRRAALGTLLGAALLGLPLPPVAAKRKATRKGKGKPKRRGRDRDRRQPRPQRRRPAQTEAAGRCCSRNACVPGPGANLGKCCFEDAELAGENFQGANLGQANFARANLTGVNFRGANLDRTCLVDADVTGARFGGANTGTAIYCRTRTDAGEDNSGCHRGTVCCPTCDEAHPCADDEVCCDGRCVTGDCCDNGEQSTCNAEEICCEHRCAAGECCAASDCPNETCQRRACRDHQCAYTPVEGEPGPRCQTVCCQDAQGEPVCCEAGVALCQPDGRCGCGGDADCAATQRCCAGLCVPRATCCEGDNAEGCAGELHCCVRDGTGVCRECCEATQCPDETCQTKRCEASNTCAYTPVFGDDGPGCATTCCETADGQPVCCGGGVTACAADRTCPPGCDVCPTGCSFTNLKDAVEGTLANGTIRLCPGTYPTNGVSIRKNLTIIGAGAGSDPATDTILSGGNTSEVLTIAFGTATIQDLTVTEGAAASEVGGIASGITVFFDATLTLERVDIVGNTTTIPPTGGTASGGLSVYAGSTVQVKASRIANNTTQGGFSATGGGISNFGDVTLEATRVEGNSARGGGGIWNDGQLTLNPGVVVTMNTATQHVDPLGPLGSGIYNRGTLVDNDPETNVLGNTPDTFQCVNVGGTGCPA